MSFNTVNAYYNTGENMKNLTNLFNSLYVGKKKYFVLALLSLFIILGYQIIVLLFVTTPMNAALLFVDFILIIVCLFFLFRT